ncbi:MAG TPA: 16S rRNA (guanine(966)-N(2))-methyltransferase RsmD [Burkholderiales bacterium]|nr:16S rRNA (guanine(966)-N(2))-methyltransferase RsmD [Burkholderiales bacterium]
MRQNRVRVIAGRWRSRLLRFPDAPGLRPTPDRVRETLFNWLGQDLTGLICLDLFAGSGALGFEAASRGARQLVLLERDRRIVESLQGSARALQAGTPVDGTVEVVRSDALEFLAHDRRVYDVVFIDPPYAFWEQSPQPLPALLSRAAERLRPGARVYLESPDFPELPQGWRSLRRARAGAVHFQLLEHEADIE